MLSRMSTGSRIRKPNPKYVEDNVVQQSLPTKRIIRKEKEPPLPEYSPDMFNEEPECNSPNITTTLRSTCKPANNQNSLAKPTTNTADKVNQLQLKKATHAQQGNKDSSKKTTSADDNVYEQQLKKATQAHQGKKDKSPKNNIKRPGKGNVVMNSARSRMEMTCNRIAGKVIQKPSSSTLSKSSQVQRKNNHENEIGDDDFEVEKLKQIESEQEEFQHEESEEEISRRKESENEESEHESLHESEHEEFELSESERQPILSSSTEEESDTTLGGIESDIEEENNNDISKQKRKAEESNNERAVAVVSKKMCITKKKSNVPPMSPRSMTLAVLGLSFEMKEVNNHLRRNKSYEIENEEVSDSPWPLLTMEDLKHVELRLKEDERFRAKLVFELGQKKRETVQATVSAIMSEVLSIKLARSFTFRGKRAERKPFCGLRLYHCLKVAIQKKFPDVADRTIEERVGRWLIESRDPRKNRKMIVQEEMRTLEDL